jgi:aminopeptidase-like protein
MLNIIKDLHKMNRCLLGEGYDNALEYLKQLIDLDIIEIPSGTEVGTWTVPDEWIVRDAWVKYRGKKVLDYKKDPLCLAIGSIPFQGIVTAEEFKKRLNVTKLEEIQVSTCKVGTEHLAVPFTYLFYEKDWEFNIKRKNLKQFKKRKGKYEVFIDTEYKPGKMKIGIHTIKGELDREILLFAHLDHPFQSNDNLSGVACLVDLAKKLKCEHTMKIIFCPETIGSIAYAATQDISKVDFVIALDIVGNDHTLLLQKSFDKFARLNFAMYLAATGLGIDHRKAEFRFLIGSDEYFFNDPKVGIPGVMLSRHPYPEYHTSMDKPDIIKKEKLEETQTIVQKIIEIMEKDYVPERHFKGPLFRKRFDCQTVSKAFNRNLDYLIYLIDGEKSLIRLCVESGVGFDYAYKLLGKLKDENLITDTGKKPKQTFKT